MSDNKMKYVERRTNCKCIIKERPIKMDRTENQSQKTVDLDKNMDVDTDDCSPRSYTGQSKRGGTDSCSDLYEEIGNRLQECLMQKRNSRNSARLENARSRC